MTTKVVHRTTHRILNILSVTSTNKNGYTLTELSNLINAPKSSISPILSTMLDEKYLSFNPSTLKYHVGIKAFELGQAYIDQVDILKEISNEMNNIVNVSLETCHFGVLDGGDVLYVLTEQSTETIRMISHVGTRIRAYATALGKALLSDHSLAELRSLYPDDLEPITQNTITDLKILSQQLEQVRIEGIAYETEESNLHIQCLAVPIKKNNEIIAALSLAIPIFRANEEKIDLCKNLLFSVKKIIESLVKHVEIDSLF